MKKAVSLFLIVLLCLTCATACGEKQDKVASTVPAPSTETPSNTDGGTTAPTTAAPVDQVNPIVGSWEGSGITWTFKADGTIEVTDGTNYASGTYTTSGDRLTIVSGGQTTAGTFVVAGDKLTMTNDNGSVQTLNKVAAAPSSTTSSTAPTPTGAVSSGNLVGTWLNDAQGYELVLNADGTGVADGDACTWGTSGNIITLIKSDDQTTVKFVYGLSGNSLVFFVVGSDGVTSDGTVAATFTKK